MSKVLQWTELSLIFFAQAAADIESRALLGLIILSLCLDKNPQNPVAPSTCCFQMFPAYIILSICSEQFLKANLVANASAGSAGHCGAPLAAVVVVVILLWCFSSCCSCCCSCSVVVVLLLLLLLPFSFFPKEFFFGTDFNKTRYLRCFVDIPAPNPDICRVLYRPRKKHWSLLPMQHAKTLLFAVFVCFLLKTTLFRSFLSYVSCGQIRNTLWLKPQMLRLRHNTGLPDVYLKVENV